MRLPTVSFRPIRKAGSVAAAAILLVSSLGTAPAARASATFINVDTTSQSINSDAACSLEEAIYSINYHDNVAPDPSDLVNGGLIRTGCAPGDGDDNILLPPNATFVLTAPVEGRDNYLGPTGTPYVTSSIWIYGRGSTIVHSASSAPFRAFSVADNAVGAGDPSLAFLFLSDLDIKGFSAKGGDGASGGGGGLGAGGAIYVNHASL